MIAAPAMTPMTSATCCFQGVASTSWPVFRSCRLLLAMAATANTTEVTNSAIGDQRRAAAGAAGRA